MPKFLTIEAVQWAKERLFGSCKSLFADFLILKREGLRPANPVTITSVSTAASAERLMGIHKSEGERIDFDHFFFNPFDTNKFWRQKEYPRSGTYTTVERSAPFKKIVNVERVNGGLRASLKDAYEGRLQEVFRLRASHPVKIPWQAIAIWCSRYDSFDDDATLEDLLKRFCEEYHFLDSELAIVLTDEPPSGIEVFGNESFPADALIAALGYSPSTAAPPGGQAPDQNVPSAASDAPTQPLSDAEMEALPDNLLEFLRGELLMPASLLRQIVTLIRAGKHLILTGPPGTGKTTLAARIAEASKVAALKYDLPSCDGVIFTTATADWSTFDTLGGYVPNPDTGALTFSEGLFLDAIRNNKWVVIDELNRADVDKAFGQFFTLLSGHGVRTPFKIDSEHVHLRIDHNSEASSFNNPAEYMLGSGWRMVATMNTFDRNMLFQLSAAFIRRFAVVYVGVPPTEELVSWISQRDMEQEQLERLCDVMRLVNAIRPIGPAIWADIVDYLDLDGSEGTTALTSLREAITAFIIPQMDGLDPDKREALRAGLQEILQSDQVRDELSAAFEEMA